MSIRGPGCRCLRGGRTNESNQSRQFRMRHVMLEQMRKGNRALRGDVKPREAGKQMVDIELCCSFSRLRRCVTVPTRSCLALKVRLHTHAQPVQREAIRHGCTSFYCLTLREQELTHESATISASTSHEIHGQLSRVQNSPCYA